MCSVSVIYDYGRTQVPLTSWTRDSWVDFKDIIRRLEALDKKLGEPDCEDPAKAAWMREVEARLAALEAATTTPENPLGRRG